MTVDGAIQALFKFHPCIYCFMFKSTEDMHGPNAMDQNMLSLLANLNQSSGYDIYSIKELRLTK